MGESKQKPGSGDVPAPKNTRIARRGRFVKKIALRILLAFAIVLLVTILYLVWFMAGKPEPTVDYVAILNETTRPEGLTLENNAWPHYEKAIGQYTPYQSTVIFDAFSTSRNPWFDELDEPAQHVIGQWIADNEEAWQSFVEGTWKPHCWQEYKRSQEPDPMIALDVPTLHLDRHLLMPLRHLMTVATWRIRSEAHTGQTAAALEDCLALVRAGVQWSKTGSLFDSLLALPMANVGHRELLKVVAQAPPDGIDWQRLEADLTEAYHAGPLEMCMQSARLEALDIVQHTFTRGGIGGGHLIPRYIWPLTQLNSLVITMSPLPEKPNGRQRGIHLAIALAHARRDATILECNRRYTQIEQILALTPYELSHSGITIADERPNIFNYRIRFDSFFREARHFAIELSAPAAERFSELRWRSHAWHDVTRTVLAVKQWREEHGQYPATLEPLFDAGGLEPPPLDPYSDTTLIYRRTADDFVLYSRGRNLRDDGGVPEIDPHSPWDIWGTKEAGDAVFWPVR
jgi:hypothetical protein